MFILLWQCSELLIHCICRAGRGALARYGDFWYPVRLIKYLEPSKKWRIRWWRECSFDMPVVGIASGSELLMPVLIDERDVVDSLWGNAKARRKIRVRHSI
jgi:hypothetical protein